MDQQQLQVLFRQGQAQPGYTVSNENIVLLPFPGDQGMQVAAAYAATVTDTDGRQSTFVLGYSSIRHTEAARMPDADRFFYQLGNPFLEGAYERETAARRCEAATRRAWVPRYPLADRFSQLKQEYALAGDLVSKLQSKLETEGDLLDARRELFELQTLLGMMQVRSTNLPVSRDLRDDDANSHYATQLVEAMMGNFACYPAATVAPFMPTKSNPLVGHLHVQHGLATVANSRVTIELKRRYRQAHNYLSTGEAGL